MPRLLIVEGKVKRQPSLKLGLEAEGYEVVAVTRGREGLKLVAGGSQHFDLVLLDLLLPDQDGLQILGELRARHNDIPVLIITARGTIEDRVAGLDAGADDYLVKPFSFAELVARLRALLRRASGARSPLLRVLDLELDLYSRRVSRSGREIELTRRQFDLLAFLMHHQNQTVTRAQIAQDVWRESTATWSNVIDVLINQIRKKVERPDLPPIVHTIRGEGYLLGARQ